MYAVMLHIHDTGSKGASVSWGTPNTCDKGFVANGELRKHSICFKMLYDELLLEENAHQPAATKTTTGIQLRKAPTAKSTPRVSHQKCYVPCRDLKFKVDVAFDPEQKPYISQDEKAYYLNCINYKEDNFLFLQTKIMTEQRRYVQYVMNLAKTDVINYHVMSESFKIHLEELLAVLQARVQSMEPSKYYLVRPLPLSHPSRKSVHLVPAREMLATGTVATFDSSTLYKSKISLNLETSTLFEKSFFLESDAPVSADPEALNLANKTSADIVISADTLEILMDCHPNHPQNCAPDRDICVTVTQEPDEGGKLRNVVVIDSALPPKHFSPLEKKMWYCQHAAQNLFCKKNYKVYSFAERKEVEIRKEAASKPLNYEELLRFHEEDQLLRAKDAVKEGRCTNQVYGLWRLKYEEADRLAAKDKRGTAELVLLIRANYDSYEWIQEQATLSCVSVKLEHQPQYGAQTCNVSELTRDWLKLLLRPNSILNRVRANASDLEVIQIQKLSLQKVTEEASKCNVNMSHCLGALHHLLQHLHTLQPDKYLLRLHPKSGQAELLRQAVNLNPSDKYFDVLSFYKDQSTRPVPHVPYCKISCDVVTPRHRYFQQIPATFPESQGEASPNRQVNKRKRGRFNRKST